jgi:hypothetical protein
MWNQSKRLRTQAIIAEADRSVMTRFGLADYRVQFSYSSQHRSVTVANVCQFFKRHLSGGMPSTRMEQHHFASGREELTTRLDIRGEQLYKVELTATPECVGAANDWGRQVRAYFPHAEIVVNGNQLE